MLAAGMIAVPTFPPNSSGKLDRLKSIKNDSSAKYILCSKSLAIDLTSLTLNREHIIYIEDLISLKTTLEVSPAPNVIRSGEIAFLQYTSGSTGSPKGVCVSHGNIINNLSLIQNVVQTSVPDDKQTLVSWLTSSVVFKEIRSSI